MINYNKLESEGFSKSRTLLISGLVCEAMDPNDFDQVRTYVSKCVHYPRNYYLVLMAINEVLDGYGVEYHEGFNFEYVNMGDTYTLTVIYDWDKKEYFLTSWGDYVEELEKKGRQD